MPALSELKAQFLQTDRMSYAPTYPPKAERREIVSGWHTVEKLKDAEGVIFLCPKCFVANGGEIGTHYVVCWFVGKVPDSLDPKPGRWIPSGRSLKSLSFVGPAAASVALKGGCEWHGFIRNGEATLF